MPCWTTSNDAVLDDRGIPLKVAPIRVLRERAEARAILFWAGEFTLGDALDPLFDYATKTGLIKMFGLEAMQQIIHDAFGIEPQR